MMLAAAALFAQIIAGPATSPTPAVTSVPTTAAPNSPSPAPMILVTPAPLRTPPPHFPQRDGSGIVRFVYDAGRAAEMHCAPGPWQCAVIFDTDDGERILHVSAIRGGQNTLWSIQPSNPGPDVDPDPSADSHWAHLYFSALPGAPATNIFVETTERAYQIKLVPDPRSKGIVYGYDVPNAQNTVTIPIAPPRTYQYGHTQPTWSGPTPPPCRFRGYTMEDHNQPSFHPINIIVADGMVRVDFAPGTSIPSVGAPTDTPDDISHLSLLPVSSDVGESRRSIVVEGCYPTITLYSDNGHERRAIVLSGY